MLNHAKSLFIIQCVNYISNDYLFTSFRSNKLDFYVWKSQY